MRASFRSITRMPIMVRVALAVVIANIVVAVLAPVLAPHGETEIVAGPFEPWGGLHPLGTDNLGRDMLTRLIYGARNTIGLSLLINCLSFVIGAVTGMFSALVGGATDYLLGRLMDVVMAFPQLILALLMLAIFGSSVTVLILTIVALDAARFFRLSRSVAEGIAAMEYVETARLRGEGLWWCIRREILPNMGEVLAAEFGIRLCYVILFISGLSFLGLGLQPPAADWGSMVRDTASLITFGDITPLLPGLAIACFTVSVNSLMDWLLQRTDAVRI